MSKEEILKALENKYDKLNIPLNTMLEGLLHSAPTTYWDYIQTDALLSLQTPRTAEKDEMVFIMYHQVNELLFKMILWEIDQISLATTSITVEKFSTHLMRTSRYFDMLCNSFDVMSDGMDVEQYLKFRTALAPASGFQSEQYRKIEFASTEVINLIDVRYRDAIDINLSLENTFDQLYWQAAGKNEHTGEKSTVLQLFEKKYKETLLEFIETYKECNLSKKFKELPENAQNNETLVNAMRHYDYTVNVKWVLAHYNTASKYLGGGEKDLKSTGGTDWRKYMHPTYQRRIFFPYLWSKDELKNWGTF